jgi:hypothetical protein
MYMYIYRKTLWKRCGACQFHTYFKQFHTSLLSCLPPGRGDSVKYCSIAGLPRDSLALTSRLYSMTSQSGCLAKAQSGGCVNLVVM